jgi:hypothetical protein
MTEYDLFNYHRREYWDVLLKDIRKYNCFFNMSINGLLGNVVKEDSNIIKAYDETNSRTGE